MSRRLEIHYNNKRRYDIVIASDLSLLCENMKTLDIDSRKICIVSDSTVSELYLDEVKKEIEKLGNPVFDFVFPAGEENKKFSNIIRIWEYLIENRFDRKDVLVALGGGVVGDMTGFAAACYLRGIRFIQVPTTLLADVDSSIGGKTGVDHDAYKNMIGAFHMPELVYINTSFLNSLSDRLFNSGMGEVIKHGLIKDSTYYKFLTDNCEKIKNRDKDTITEMIFRSCDIKRAVVENDPTEKGERALLNFGHTLGHAIEKLSNFSVYHGECVELGCICALHISRKRGLISSAEYDEAIKLFEDFNFKLNIDNIKAADVVRVSKNDKKMDGNKIKFILLKNIGEAYIDTTVTDDEMLDALKAVLTNED